MKVKKMILKFKNTDLESQIMIGHYRSFRVIPMVPLANRFELWSIICVWRRAEPNSQDDDSNEYDDSEDGKTDKLVPSDPEEHSFDQLFTSMQLLSDSSQSVIVLY